MDPTVALVLGVLWLLVNLFSGKKKSPPPNAPRREPRPPSEPSAPDATQREGSRLERVLREFERALEEAEAGPTGRRGEPLPDDEDMEERESLEREPVIVSLEQEVRRPPRREFTQDADAESLVKRRIAAAAVRDTARTKSDHLAFDQQIRQESADHTATRGYTNEQLRHAVVWREILGPPVSLREEPGSER